jgi:hypothetical protein
MGTILAAALLGLTGTVFAVEQAELHIEQSPDESRVLQLATAESVIDTDVSPSRTLTAALIRNADSQTLRFWNFATNRIVSDIKLPSDTKIGAIAWHPHDEGLYAIQHKGNDWQIVRLANNATTWSPTIVYRATVPLRRMVFSRQRFAASHLSPNRKSIEYRLYFGAQTASGKWEIRTIRESGEAAYVLAGPAPTPLPLAYKEDPDSKGNQFTLPNPLPSSFHPSGVAMVIQNEKGCFAEMHYREWLQGQVGLDGDHKDDWEAPRQLQWDKHTLCGGSLTYTPNGMGFFHWQKGQPGLLYLNRKTGEELKLASETTFISTPSSAADGKGVVGVTQKTGTSQQLEYVPVQVPLGDVLNAWMFIERPDELNAFNGNGGLFRPTTHGEQLYGMYDEESYSSCGSYPKRPHLITTDLFWENFGAAFEASFILNERYRAIPAFSNLVAETNRFFKEKKEAHRLAKVFEVTARILRSNISVHPEAALEADAVLAGISSRPARLLGESVPVSFNQFKPRGHYTKSDVERRYFSAMRYLTSVHLKEDEVKIIASLPASVQQQAGIWVDSYRPFIAAPRSPFAWSGLSIPQAKHLNKPSKQHTLFPLSWGSDNETFYNTTSHSEEDEPLGDNPRLLPSGLDLAFVFGSDYAQNALANELTQYPRLAKRLDKLRAEIGATAGKDDVSLYDSWLGGLSKQWDAEVNKPGSAQMLALDASSKDLWSAKRLQTGLASWATLRHTTLLVNDQSAAEGGQGGFSFEPLVFPPPRGYVEPDPKTFQTIADLYGKLITALNASAVSWPKDKAAQDLHKGVLDQLGRSRQLVADFGSMAARLVKGETLRDDEYKLIENIGGAVEHDFLLMKSTQINDQGLALPDPISKIADVAQAPGVSLEVAVGKPMEWDQVVPFYGKRELVRGAVYSYFEFASNAPLTDEDWRKQEAQTPHPAWIRPFIINNHLGCPNVQK